MLSFLARAPQEAWIGIAIGCVMVAGLIRLVLVTARCRDRLDFANQYRGKFIEYADSKGIDQEAYRWLMLNASKMQNSMGHFGIISHFRKPFEAGYYSNYPIILNALPEIRSLINNDIHLWRQQIVGYLDLVDEAILRYLGPLQEELITARSNIRNPFRWFSAGMSMVVAVPLYLLQLFGVMGGQTVAWVQRTPVFRFFTAMGTLLGVAASIVGLLVDWSNAVAMVRGWFGLS